MVVDTADTDLIVSNSDSADSATSLSDDSAHSRIVDSFAPRIFNCLSAIRNEGIGRNYPTDPLVVQ